MTITKSIVAVYGVFILCFSRLFNTKQAHVATKIGKKERVVFETNGVFILCSNRLVKLAQVKHGNLLQDRFDSENSLVNIPTTRSASRPIDWPCINR